MIHVVDYGLGNVQAFLTMYKRLGFDAARARTEDADGRGRAPGGGRDLAAAPLAVAGSRAGAGRRLGPRRGGPPASPSPPLMAVAVVPAAPPPRPIPRRLTTPGGCPYMPAFADARTVVFDDGRGDLWAVPVTGGAPRPLIDAPGEQWRAGRGRRDGEVIFVGANGPATLAVASGETTTLGIDAFAVAASDAAFFDGRTDVAEIWRRAAGEEARVVALPDGLWQYALSVSGDGRRVAITTHAQRSTNTICVIELGDAARPLDCLDRADVIMGRAALTHDGATLYYQTAPASDGTRWPPRPTSCGCLGRGANQG